MPYGSCVWPHAAWDAPLGVVNSPFPLPGLRRDRVGRRLPAEPPGRDSVAYGQCQGREIVDKELEEHELAPWQVARVAFRAGLGLPEGDPRCRREMSTGCALDVDRHGHEKTIREGFP